MWPRPRSAFVPSGILVHSAVWPQLASVGQKVPWGKGAAVPLFGGELFLHLTRCRLGSPSVTSGILIHAAVSENSGMGCVPFFRRGGGVM